MSTVTIEEGIRRLKEFGQKSLPRATKRAIYRALDVGKDKALTALTKTTLGVAVRRRADVQLRLAGKFIGPIQGGRPTSASSIPLIVQKIDIKDSYVSGSLGVRTYASGLRTMGFAALIESGGRTKSHQIKPIRLGGYSRKRRERMGQLLAQQPMRFRIGGRWVAMRIVSHPGSRIPRNPFLTPGVSAARDVLGSEFDRSVRQAVSEAGLDG